jgi:2-methylcitrate dehydratase
VTIKRFPSMGTSQASASAALQLHERLKGRTERIKAMTFRISDSPLTRHQITGPYRRPNNRETADHSFPAVIAMTLADGGLSQRQFERDRFLDADVLELIDRIDFVCDLAGVDDGSYPAQVTATLDDGTTVTEKVDHAPGHPGNPMNADLATQKFLECSTGILPMGAAGRVCTLCLRGDNITIRNVLAELA